MDKHSIKMDHLAVSVKDVEHSAEFYRTVLNLQEIPNKTENSKIRWFSLGDGKELHLISTIREEVKLNKACHLAFTTNDFDSLIKRLESRDIIYSDFPGNPNSINIRKDGIKQVFFQDPDDYWLEVNNVAEFKGLGIRDK